MLKTLCVILCLLGPYNLLAQEQFYGSFFVGIGDTFGLDTEKNVELTVGGRGGLLFYERLEVGLYYNYYQSQEASKAVEIRSLLGELSFYPFRGPSEGSALFVGALAGTSDITNIGSLSKETTLGTRLGYDVRLGPKVSVSPEFYWLYILGSESFSLWGAHLVGTIRF